MSSPDVSPYDERNADSALHELLERFWSYGVVSSFVIWKKLETMRPVGTEDWMVSLYCRKPLQVDGIGFDS